MLQFDLLCSAAESEALRNVPDIDLMHEVTAMGLRVRFTFLTCSFYFSGRSSLRLYFHFLDVHGGY